MGAATVVRAARSYVPALVFIAWLLAVHVAYYAAHKPLDGNVVAGWGMTMTLLADGVQLAGLLATLGALLTAAAIAAVAVAIGAVPARLLTGGDCTLAAALALSGALGLGLVGTLTLGLSALHFLTPTVVAGTSLVLGAVGMITVLRTGRWWHDSVPSPRTLLLRAGEDAGEGIPRWRPLLLTFLLTLAAAATLRAAAPPTGWDSLVYHLTGPKLWLREGGFVYGLDLPHMYFPALMEHLYAAAMALHSDRAAQVLHGVAAAFTVLLTMALADQELAPGAGLLAGALLLSAASLTSLAGKAYVDWTLMLFVTGALWAALRLRMRPTLPAGVLTGILCGLAAATKYTAAGPLLGVLALLAAGPGSAGVKARSLAVVGVTAALVFAPWALRDLALTGNPVYPFVFDGWNWDAWRAAWFARPGTGLVLEPWRLLLVPWEVTALGAEGSPLYDGTIGPVFLTLLLPSVWLLRRPSAVRPLALFAAIGYLVWLVGVAASSLLLQVRLLYPIFPALAVLTTAGLWSLRTWATPAFRPQRIAAAAVALDLALVAVGEVGRVGADTVAPILVGAETPEQFRTRVLGEHATAVGTLAERAGAAARVLFLWEPRTYLCPVSCGPDALLFNFRDALRRSGSASGVAAFWRAQGYTHVLLHGAGLRFFTQPPHVEMAPEHVAALLEVEQCCLERMDGLAIAEALHGMGGRYTLYRLKDAP